MNLSTRLSAAMVALVLLTALAVGYLSYRNIEAIVIPAEATRLDSRARMQAAVLDSHVRYARADLLASTGSTGLNSFLRASIAGGNNPSDQTPASLWRERFAQNLVSHLSAKPDYYQFRVIGLADGGREVVRVDRSGTGGTIRIVPDHELQQKGDRDYFKHTIALGRGEVYISPITLNQEHGVVETPRVPIIRLGTPIFGPDGKKFGIVIINIDMRPAFAELRRSAREGGLVYLVNEAGDYLVHPDVGHEFGWELGRAYRVQDEFPDLSAATKASANTAHEVRNGAGEDFVMGSLQTRLAGGPQIMIVDSLPLDVVLASAATVGQSSLIGAIVAALCAGLLAVLTARSLTQPLRSLTKSLERFTGEETIKIPEGAAGEIGVLAGALKRMADAVREKTGALQQEIEGHRRAQITISEFAEREKLYLATVESANDAIFTVDLAGTITTWNPAAERVFGFSAAEAIGKNVSVIATPDQQEEQKNNFERIKRGKRLENFETTRIRKDGSTVHLSYNSSPILSAAGEIVGASAIARDITERKRSEKALQQYAERERLYIAAVKSANDAVFTSDLEGNLTTWNPAAERLFGYSAEEAIGKNVSIIARPDQWAEQKRFLAVIARGERVEGIEAVRWKKNGDPIEVSFNFSPIYSDAGEPIGGAAIARDITERKRHEKAMAERSLELQRSNAELEQFAYVASHDLQEPLRMVASYAELLADRYQGKLDEKADKYIGYAVDGAKRMQRLVNDLLTYSRVGTQGHPLQATDAGTVVGHALRALKQKIEEAGAKVEVETLPVVNADEVQLGQIFQNLIGNALKFRCPDRPPRIRIGAQQSRQGCTFFVEDNGIGIDKQYDERIFQMFQRLHDRETYEGSGIGLTIAKKIVERHGGRIWFESEPGKGTTFFFTLTAIQEKAA